ncbi:MAG: phospho-N-acetylmuramoyl-pentapeptide-transferase [Pseudomonadota bacterium]|nr:phospho-N-acetylmuramoyl-pentapeptide-transferase [Pseudomonadota bacterium]MDE3038548.1 phospho-N-acetylmuramoyl-pentapeptide-transferase [Pseudomonadota bacterium]
MLYNLLVPLAAHFEPFNLFRYLTFRSGGAVFTALVISFYIGPKVIRRLKSGQAAGQPIRLDGPESHLVTKKGTPTMGGVMILIAVGMSTLLWADLANPYVWIVLLVTLGFGGIGFVDDFLKLTRRNSKGLSSRRKIIAQAIISTAAAVAIQYAAPPGLASEIAVPFFKNVLIDVGIFYIPFALIVMIGASNAVNLTDGLDGLAIVPIMIVAGCFALITYLVGNIKFADYLQLHYIPGAGELAVFCAALVGASLGFLWFNAPPAQVFMGDTGSLAFGGSIGAISVIARHEFVLAIIGGLFVVEAVSVILQVASFKMTGKRIFKMAPIHHHFEKLGWQEPTIVIRFWIIACIFALLGLATLKLR